MESYQIGYPESSRKGAGHTSGFTNILFQEGVKRAQEVKKRRREAEEKLKELKEAKKQKKDAESESAPKASAGEEKQDPSPKESDSSTETPAVKEEERTADSPKQSPESTEAPVDSEAGDGSGTKLDTAVHPKTDDSGETGKKGDGYDATGGQHDSPQPKDQKASAETSTDEPNNGEKRDG